MAKIDRDKLFLVSRANAANGAQAALHPIQDLPPHEQLAAIAVLFVTLCKQNGIEGREADDLGQKLTRLEPFHRQANTHIEALQDFAQFNHVN